MKSVLLVDDEAGIRNLLSRWTETMGYEPRVAATAEQALDVMENEVSPVAVCDITMPGRSGLWLASELRRRHPATAIVMATGIQDVQAAVDSLRTGVVDYLVKPFGREQLREALTRAMDWHARARIGRASELEPAREPTTRLE